MSPKCTFDECLQSCFGNGIPAAMGQREHSGWSDALPEGAAARYPWVLGKPTAGMPAHRLWCNGCARELQQHIDGLELRQLPKVDSGRCAARELTVALGYANVAVYPGGKQDWSGAGFPVERGEALAK